MNRDEFQKPSQLLHEDHRKPDPIIPVLEKLDPELDRLSNLYHKLKEHDSLIRLSCPTQSEAFRTDYDRIKSTLTENISINANMQRNKENELDQMQRQKTMLDNDQKHRLRPLEQQMQREENEKYSLLEQKRRIEEQLRKIDEDLAKREMFIKDTERGMADINDDFKPRMEELDNAIYDRQFEIAGYAQVWSLNLEYSIS